MRAIHWLVIHTSATADKKGVPVDATVDQMRAYHIEHNGWDDVGYHYVVRMSGAIEHGRDVADVGAHVGGMNADTIGICVSGHGDLAPFKAAQRVALAALCADLCGRFNLTAQHVIGHCETDDHGGPAVSKTCPGVEVDMNVIRLDVEAELARHRDAPRTPRGPLGIGPDPNIERRFAALEQRIESLERLLHAA